MHEPLGHDGSAGGWDDEDDVRGAPLTREEAQALRARNPSVSPWRVVAAQSAIGGAAALFAWLLAGSASVAWSALYGAAVAVLPGALMARGASRKAPSPGLGFVSLLSWSFVKIAVSVVLLLLAPKLVQPLSWPALLVALVLCLQVYWFALLWRGR